MKLTTRGSATLVLALMLGAAAPALGQDRVLVFEEEQIEGEIEKPEAFYILSPSSLEYQALEPAESFLPQLYETVREEPF